MFDALNEVFACVCGQSPGHTWAPGGVWLPCCQRCLGVYAGAGLAALAHLVLRPRLGSRFLETHGLFLLLMVPFGFHWVSQGPVLRAVTGVLFGCGVFTFLWLPLRTLVVHASACWWTSFTLKGGHQTPTRRPRESCSTSTGTLRRNASFERVGLYFLVLGATVFLVPWLGSEGGRGAALGLAGLAAWGVMALVGALVGDLGSVLLAVIRRVRQFPRPLAQP